MDDLWLEGKQYLPFPPPQTEVLTLSTQTDANNGVRTKKTNILSILPHPQNNSKNQQYFLGSFGCDVVWAAL